MDSKNGSITTTHPEPQRYNALTELRRTALEPELFDRAQLYEKYAGKMRPASFDNWLWRATNRHGFPRPLVIGDRSVRWVAAEVRAWFASRPRSDGSRSPNPRARTRVDGAASTPEAR